MPVKQFWALTVYDRATFSFIYSDSNRTTLSSYDLDKMNLRVVSQSALGTFAALHSS
jgi:hypothetical protein